VAVVGGAVVGGASAPHGSPIETVTEGSIRTPQLASSSAHTADEGDERHCEYAHLFRSSVL